MAKSKKEKKEKHEGTKTPWQDFVREAVINDDEWKCHVILLAEGDCRFTEYLTMFHTAAKNGLRRSIKSISYLEEIKNTKIQKIRHGGAVKQKRQNSKGPQEQGFAKFLNEAQQALQDALKEVKNNPYLVPGDLLALFVKLLILMTKEFDIELYAMQLELKQELEMENMMMISAGVDKKGKMGGKSEGSQKSKESNKKGKGKETKSPENMHINKLHKRGQEWRIREFIEDQPTDGPQMYIALLGFLHSELPGHLREFGVPLTAIIKVTDKEERKQVHEKSIRNSRQTKQTGEELKSKIFTSMLNQAMPIPGASIGTMSMCDWKDPEEAMVPSKETLSAAIITDSKNRDIMPFWKGLKLVEEKDPFCLKDIALIAFHVPDFPEVSSDGSELAQQIISEIIDDPDRVKMQKKTKEHKNEKKKESKDDRERENAIYELVCNILYFIENISHQHQNFLDQTETVGLNCTALIQEVTEEDSLQLYKKMISLVPPECTTVPVILHCLLEQVTALFTCSDEFRISVSEETYKSHSGKILSQKSETSSDLKSSSEDISQTLKDLPAKQNITESYMASSQKTASQKSQQQYESCDTFMNKRFTKAAFHIAELQEIGYTGEYHVLEPEESKPQITKGSQHYRASSRNEYLLQEPHIILHGDTADLLTFHLEVPDIDVWSIIIKMLEKNPVALLWRKYPPLQPVQYIKCNYDFNRLWNAMGGSTKCSRDQLRNFLALATFEQLCNVEKQGCADSSELQEKYTYKSKTKNNDPADLLNTAVNTSLYSENVSCTSKEDALVQKLQFPQFCSIYLTPFRMESLGEMTSNDLNRSSLPEIHLKKEKIPISKKLANERTHSLLDVCEMLECSELMQLLESQKYATEVEQQDYPFITSTHRYLEQLSKPVMLQTLQKYMVTFKSLKYKFSPLMDSLLLFFYHGDKWGIWKDKWCANIQSPIALRDFYDYIFYKKAKESAQMPLTQINLLKATSKGDLKLSMKEFQSKPQFTDDSFILENSIKYKVNVEKKPEPEQETSSEDKLKGKIGKKAKKDDQESKKNKNLRNQNVYKAKGSSKSEDDEKSKSDEKYVKKTMEVKQNGSQKLSSQEAPQTSVKEEFQYQIYDLGPLRMQYSGSSVVHLCSDQCHIRVDISQWLYGTPQIYSQFYKHGHTLSLYTYFKPLIGPFIKEPLMFNLITAKGVLLVFTKCSYKPPSGKISATSSVSSQKEVQETVEEELNSKAAMKKTKGSPRTADNKKNIRENKDTKKPGKVPSLGNKDSSDTVEAISYYNLKITWPNSLLIETVIEVQTDEEQSEKLCTFVPNRIDQIYIRQRYYDKGPECGSLINENYRCVLCNGNVLKFMTDDTLEVLTAYGTIYYIHKLQKRESSTSLTSTDSRNPKTVGKDNETVENAAEQSQQKANKGFATHYISETDRTSQSDSEMHLWQIKQYEMLTPDGVLYSINKDTGNTNIIKRMLCDINHDYRTGKIVTLRGDGTTTLLLPGGNLITTYSDNTTVCTMLQESLFEWTPREALELLTAEREIKLQTYQTMAENSEISLSSFEAFGQISEEMNHAVEESNGESASSAAYLKQDVGPTLEEFVMVNTTILVEHPNYATVTYDELQKDVVIRNPHGLEVKVIKKDMYSVTMDSSTCVTVKPDIIQFQASDSNLNMTSLTEVNLDILREEKDSFFENNSAPKGENESVKAETDSVPDQRRNSEEENNDVLKRERNSSILSSTRDAKGNVILVHCNGEVENHQVVTMPKKANFGSLQLENSLAHGRCIIVTRDLSGFEMINDNEVSAQLEMFKTLDDVCMDKDPVIGSPGLYSYTVIAPVYNTTSQEWLMPSSDLIKNVKKMDLIPSTYGPPESWIHPFTLNDQKLQKLEQYFGVEDVEKQRKPLAVTLQIFQEMFSKGINIANDLQEGLCRYKSMAQEMYASYLLHKYTPDKEEEEIIQTIDDLAHSPENVIRKYQIAMLEKTMLKQVAEHKYHKQTRHPSICMRKLVEEAQEADYYKDLIQTYPKHIPPYFDSYPGMCFKMVLQSTDRAIQKVEEHLEEDLPQYCRKLIPLQGEVSSNDRRHSESTETVMKKAFEKVLPKSTSSELLRRLVLQTPAEERTLEPTIVAMELAANNSTS